MVFGQTGKYCSSGCDGGYKQNTWYLSEALSGLNSEDSYPYSSGSSKTNGDCAYRERDNVFHGTGYKVASGSSLCTYTEHYRTVVWKRREMT